MIRPKYSPPGFWLCFWLLAGVCLSLGPMARAQDGSDNYESQGVGYTTENATADSAVSSDVNSGPVRMARFSYLSGNVTWRADGMDQWSPASVNLPLRQGAEIWVTNRGRAEIQFDDGSYLRLGSGAIVTLQTLYSDADGEFTEVKLTDGLAALRIKHDHSIYQIDAPIVSVKADGPASLRVGAGDGVEVAIRSGRATVEGSQGKTTLEAGDYLDLRDAESAFDRRGLPGEDSFDRWVDERDRRLAEGDRPCDRYLPSNIAIVAGDLDEYGSWRDDPHYGHVWCPHVTGGDWRPYHYGHWCWVSPFGWTWVSEEPWGWAPYHYGTWVYASYGWGWCPGPAYQYWCPAVVNFCEYNGSIAWAPLCPSEVRYPSFLSIGFRGRDWSLFFSIGQAGCYYPSGSYCVGRPWNSYYVNHVTNVYNVTNIYNYGGYGHGFLPFNARNAPGATFATTEAFGGRGGYRPLPPGATTIFSRGHSIAPPPGSRPPFSGPLGVHPTQIAYTPARAFAEAKPPQMALSRPVYRAQLPPMIARSGAPMSPSSIVRTGSHPGTGASIPDPGQNARSLPSERSHANPPVISRSRNGAEGNFGGAGSSGRSDVPAWTRARGDLYGQAPETHTGRTAEPPRITHGSGDRTGSGSAQDAAQRARESLGMGARNGRVHDTGVVRGSGSVPSGSDRRQPDSSSYGRRDGGSGYSRTNGGVPGRSDGGTDSYGRHRDTSPPSYGGGSSRSRDYNSQPYQRANPPREGDSGSSRSRDYTGGSGSGRSRDYPPRDYSPPRRDNPPSQGAPSYNSRPDYGRRGEPSSAHGSDSYRRGSSGSERSSPPSSRGSEHSSSHSSDSKDKGKSHP